MSEENIKRTARCVICADPPREGIFGQPKREEYVPGVCDDCTGKTVIELGGGNENHQHRILRDLPGYRNYDRVLYDDRTIQVELDGTAHGLHLLPAEDDSVDFIYTSHCLEHVRDLKTLLNQCARILKSGGVMEILVPHVESDKAYAIDHVRYFTRETFRSLQYSDIADYGFAPWRILYLEGERDDAGNHEIRCRMTPL